MLRKFILQFIRFLLANLLLNSLAMPLEFPTIIDLGASSTISFGTFIGNCFGASDIPLEIDLAIPLRFRSAISFGIRFKSVL